MRRKCYFILFALCFTIITNLLAQSQTSLLQNFKSKTELLDRLYMDMQRTGKTDQINKITKSQDMVLLKEELFSLKQELKGSNPQHQDPAYHLNSTNMDDNFELLDFNVYDYTTDYYRIVARLRCKTQIYTDFVKLRYNFYKSNSFIGTDYTYIDFESYGYSGMLPYQVSFLETFTDKVDFDSINFEITFYKETGNDDILWDQILELQSSQIIKDSNFFKWFGIIKNKSSYAVRFPKIFACIFKNENMIDMDYTYLDIQNDSLPPNTMGTFDSYIDLPPEYDKIKYYLSYSLYSLEGSGNITSNFPTFTQLKYSGSERTALKFDQFLIDHESDRIQTQVDWDDHSNLLWQGPFYSRSVAALNHSYSKPGTYYLRTKSKDGATSETNWSDSIKVEILPIPELKITTQLLKAGTYKNFYRDTVRAAGGIMPYRWAVSSGHLPDGLNLNFNNGEISGTASFSGSFSFCIMVTDGGNPSASTTTAFQIIINNNPPEINSPSSINIAEHIKLNYIAKAIDPDGNAISYKFEKYPMWLTPANTIISGIPPEGAKDTSFVVIASDGELNDTLKVSVTVIPVNDPPVIISLANATAVEDSLFQYVARATDPERDKITYAFKNYPHWLTAADSTISGIPKEGTKDSSFVIIANDGELSDSMKITITIISINDPPKLISAKIDTAYEDLLFSYVAKAIDHEHDKINYSFANYPKWLAPTDSMISGIPKEGAKDTSIKVIASDNYLSDTLMVTIIVVPINDAPQIRHLSDFIFENNETYSINLDTCVTDEDNDVESLTWKVIPSDANLTMNMTNHVVSFNALNWTGTTETKFIVTDPQGASDSAMIKITVELPSTVENNENTIPKDFFLSQNYPNPFNPQTTIHFGIPKFSEVSIDIYNLKGEIVEKVFKGRKEAGNHLVIWDAKDQPSGIYLIKFQADGYIQVKKCLLMK